MRVQVIRLPDALTKVLAESEELLGQIIDGESSQFTKDGGNSTAMLRHRLISAIDSELEAISEQVEKDKLERYRKTLVGYLHRIRALGPSHVGPNLLLLPDLKSSSGVTASQNGRGGILVSSRCYVSERLGFVGHLTQRLKMSLKTIKYRHRYILLILRHYGIALSQVFSLPQMQVPYAMNL